MNYLLRSLLLLGAVLATALSAQTGDTALVTGRVSDGATRLSLGGAKITVIGSTLETYTGSDGSYVLANVPAGTQTLEISYVGYPTERQTVTIGAGSSVRVDATFGGDAIQMERFVIEGSAVGSARAINQQRAADTLTNIVAADEIGRFPDQNAAESLQRLPGVSLYRDQGEGRFVNLRGLNYIYTSVTLNGAKMASPEVGGRFIALDVVPADTLATLTVTKVPTPDMDGEGLGGVVDIKTKSALDASGANASFSAQTIHSALRDAYGYKVNGSVSNAFGEGDRKLGLLLGFTWQERKFGSHNYEIDDGWTERTPPGGTQPVYFLQDVAFRDYVIDRERTGLNAAIDFKPDAFTHYSFKAVYNRFTDTEDRHVSFVPFLEGTVSALDAGSATVTSMRRARRDVRHRAKDQTLTGLEFSGEKQVGAWTFDGRAAWSRGREDKPEEVVFRWRRNAADSSFRYEITDTYDLNVTQLAGPSSNDATYYTNFNRASLTSEMGDEKEANLAFNARYDLGGSRYLKTGASYRAKDKVSAVDYWEYSAAPAAFTFASVATEQGDYPYFRAPRINAEAASAYFFANRAQFTNPTFAGGSVPADSLFDDWTSEEEIAAAYVMGGATFGRTNLIAGLRGERTYFLTRGNDLRLDEDGVLLQRNAISATHNYTNWLPGVHLRHDFAQNLVLRASISKSMMRPEFSDSAIRRNINVDDLEVFQGNPNVEALESVNYDLSLEYYLPSLGVASVSVFNKQVDNFSYEYTADDPLVIGGTAYELSTIGNGSDGDISGVEFAYQQQLRFLPSPFDGLGFMANLTLVDSSATYPTRVGEELPFIGQSDTTGNVALTYEKGRFFARLALNYRSEHLREDEPIGGGETEDFWIDDFKQLDLSLAYKLGGGAEIFAEFTNLNDEPFRVYQKGGDAAPAKRLVQIEEYDVSTYVGVRWKL